jgi:thiol-disulfide isomerase/thioredoxin
MAKIANVILVLTIVLLVAAQKKGRAESEEFKVADTYKEEASQVKETQQTQAPESVANSADTSSQAETTEKKPKTIMVPVPQVRGRRYVHNLTDESFDAFVNKQATIVLVAADWCPNCKEYIPNFNILAYTLSEDEKYTGERWATALYYTNNRNEIDPIMKKFDLESVPKLIMIKDNRYWVFDQEKILDKVIDFVANLNYDEAKFYPSYVPDFVDDIRRFFRDIRRSLETTMQHNPEKIDQFKLLGAGIGTFFGALFLFALLFAPKSEHSADKAKKD